MLDVLFPTKPGTFPIVAVDVVLPDDVGLTLKGVQLQVVGDGKVLISHVADQETINGLLSAESIKLAEVTDDLPDGGRWRLVQLKVTV